MSARFIDASIYKRDTSHAIRIAIQLERIAIYFNFLLLFFFKLTTLREINFTIYKVDRD